ncbi:hypothetical protein BH09ACT3_BH09ACT3_16810 [soil metagenome]
MTDTAQAAAARSPAPLPEIRFRLPGDWWQVPLTDEDAARTSIRKLMRDQLGTADETANLRAGLGRRVLDGLDAAIAGDALAMHIALRIVPGAPMPAFFTVALPSIGMTPAVGTSAKAVMGVLEKTLSEGKKLDETAKRFSIRESEVLRSHRILVSSEAEDALPTLIADYWVTVPRSKRVLLITFSTALVDISEEMLGLFDSILAASYWKG